MRKLMLLAVMLAIGLMAVTPSAMAQVVQRVNQMEIDSGEAGQGFEVVPEAAPEPAPEPAPVPAPAPEPAPVPAPAPAPAPKAEAPQPKTEAPKQLPKTGGDGASMFALGAGALLVTGGLLARRTLR